MRLVRRARSPAGSLRATFARLPQQERERANANQESRELTEEDDGADEQAHGEKSPRGLWVGPRLAPSTAISTTVSARQYQCAVGLRNWIAPSAVSAMRGDRRTPGILAGKEKEEDGGLQQAGKDERVPQADKVGAKHAAAPPR